MMLRSLVDEVVRRRLWPIPIVALLVAIVAPMMFMKSASAPTASAPPPPPAAGKLPQQASVLLRTSDKPVKPVKHKPKSKDPFAPPASAATSSSSGASGAAAGETSPPQEVPVVIKNSDGSTSTATIGPSTGSTSSAGSSKPAKKTTTPKASTPKATTPKVTSPATTSSSASSVKRVPYVDVRFGERMGTMIRYRVPRLQTFRAGGRVAAMFVGYSTTRNAAVFAVAPSTKVGGVTCRKVKGVCRYVDVPAGSYARLVLIGEKGAAVSRRLDVVSIRHLPPAAPSKASARMTSLAAAKCLLKGLLSLPAVAPSISTDACA